MAAGDLTTTDRVKEYLGIDVPDFDAILGRFVTVASDWVKAQTNRRLLTGSVTDTWSGKGESVKYLIEFPVTAITSVTVDGTAVAARTTGDGYAYDSGTGRLELFGSTFAVGDRNCVVVYTAGYTTLPTDLEHAVVEFAAIQFRDRDKFGKAYTVINGQVTDFRDGGAQFAYVKGIIEKYQRVDP